MKIETDGTFDSGEITLGTNTVIGEIDVSEESGWVVLHGIMTQGTRSDFAMARQVHPSMPFQAIASGTDWDSLSGTDLIKEVLPATGLASGTDLHIRVRALGYKLSFSATGSGAIRIAGRLHRGGN